MDVYRKIFIILDNWIRIIVLIYILFYLEILINYINSLVIIILIKLIFKLVVFIWMGLFI